MPDRWDSRRARHRQLGACRARRRTFAGIDVAWFAAGAGGAVTALLALHALGLLLQILAQ